jgi:long-chain fatty acid transport protein
LLCGTGSLGVDLSQLIIAPTLAWKFHARHSIGIAPLFAYQRFKAEGLQAFQGLSTSPGNVTNNGYDSSTGWGVASAVPATSRRRFRSVLVLVQDT